VCLGGAHVTEKTVEWYSTFSSCGPSTCEVIHSELGGDKPRVAFQFKKRSKQCSFKVMQIVGQRERYWGIRGYTSVEDYRERRDDPATYAACPVDPMPSGRCNLPFRRLFRSAGRDAGRLASRHNACDILRFVSPVA
jgi:hypothetical protein